VLGRWSRCVAVALALVGLCALFDTGSIALAHAVLIRAIPSSAQTLAQPPTEVRLLFTEPLDPAFSGVRVVDATNQGVDFGYVRVDPQDDRQLVASLRTALPNGVYFVLWRSFSTIDVHPEEGRYPLYVGVPVGADAATLTVAGQNSGTPETALARWLFYVSSSLFAGVLFAWRLCISRALAHADEATRALMRGRIYRVVIVGAVVFLGGTLYAALAQAAAAGNVPIWDAFGKPTSDLLLRGRFASIWWPRLVLRDDGRTGARVWRHRWHAGRRRPGDAAGSPADRQSDESRSSSVAQPRIGNRRRLVARAERDGVGGWPDRTGRRRANTEVELATRRRQRARRCVRPLRDGNGKLARTLGRSPGDHRGGRVERLALEHLRTAGAGQDFSVGRYASARGGRARGRGVVDWHAACSRDDGTSQHASGGAARTQCPFLASIASANAVSNPTPSATSRLKVSSSIWPRYLSRIACRLQ
jgi:copper resistance protein C